MLDMATVLPRLGLATAIGILIGVERGWRMCDEEPGWRVNRVRIFTMLGLLGGLASLAAAIGLGAVAALIVVGAIAVPINPRRIWFVVVTGGLSLAAMSSRGGRAGEAARR
jgi:fatty acid desaturase